LRAHLGGQAGLIAVVKANAYGHGVAQVVPALAPHLEMFAVATLAEAREVSALAPHHPVLLLSPAAAEERAEIIMRDFIPLISSAEEAAAYSQLSRLGRAAVHLKIDTGMGRMGLWHEEAVAAVREIKALHGLLITGFASHLPVADEDDAFTREQLATFHALVKKLREEEGCGDSPAHVLNSAGALAFPEMAGEFARVGLALYGVSPRPEFQERLRPVLTWKALVTLVRDLPAGRSINYGRTFITPGPMRVATLAAGYADGYPRHLSGQGACVAIQGVRCPVLGRVTMDQLVVDVSALDDCQPGEVAVLLGPAVPATELAQRAGTIPWEIFTRLGARVARVALDSGAGDADTPAA
jgi:alanine racemase